MHIDEHWALSGKRLVVTSRFDVILKIANAIGIPASQITRVNASRSSLALAGSKLRAYLRWRETDQPDHEISIRSEIDALESNPSPFDPTI